MNSFHGMTLTCPRCLRQLEERKARSATIFGCPSCGGVLLDKAQTDIVFKRMPGGLALVTASNKAVQVSENARPHTDGAARCPACAEEMMLCEAELIRIDQCPAHGTWFDANELRQIANAEAHRERQERATSERQSSSPRASSTDDEEPDLIDWISGFFDAVDEANRRKS